MTIKIFFPVDECKNFLERMGCENLDEVKDQGKEKELRDWASFRGQTLSRTGKWKRFSNVLKVADLQAIDMNQVGSFSSN